MFLLYCAPSRIARLSRTHLAPQKSDESNGKSEAFERRGESE